MTQKMIDQSREQAKRYVEFIGKLGMDGFDFGWEETQRQLRQGLGQMELGHQTMARHWEQALSHGKAMVEVQQAFLADAVKSFSALGEARA